MKSKNILIIDPDHNTRVELRTILESEGHYVLTVPKGVDFLNLIETITFPSLIIVSDELLFMIPQDLINIIRSRSDCETIPLLQITSHPDKKLQKVTDILVKPFTKDSVLTALKNCFIMS